jgi:hypothetical protein
LYRSEQYGYLQLCKMKLEDQNLGSLDSMS